MDGGLNVARMTYLDSHVGVALPLKQAIITGVLVGLSGGCIAKVANIQQALWVGVSLGALAATLAWLAGLRWWLRSVIAIERACNASTPTSSLSAKVERVRLEIKQDNGRNMQFIDLPVDMPRLSTLADGLLRGATFNESSWTGQGAPFSRAEFRKLRTELLKRNLLEWVNPQARAQGLRLTKTGNAAMRYFANVVDLPSPTLQEANNDFDW